MNKNDYQMTIFLQPKPRPPYDKANKETKMAKKSAKKPKPPKK